MKICMCFCAHLQRDSHSSLIFIEVKNVFQNSGTEKLNHILCTLYLFLSLVIFQMNKHDSYQIFVLCKQTAYIVGLILIKFVMKEVPACLPPLVYTICEHQKLT
jgi:hypothetical protein